MQLAVTDANIFIDLIELEIIADFFALSIEVHTTLEVVEELYSIQKEVLKAYQLTSRLFVHNLATDDHERIQESIFPKGLSLQDKSVIYLAKKIGAMLLSSDKPVRKYAGKVSIEVHGMLWILDSLIEQQIYTPQQGAKKLKELQLINTTFSNNMELAGEIEKRIKKWEN
jgi:predicted nucleic acid-binding protein